MTHEPTPPASRELESLAARLPREIEPPPELWRGIAARLDAPAPRSLEARVRALPTEVTPPIDLWPAIAARLRNETPRTERQRTRVVAAAAGIVAAVALLVVFAVRDDGLVRSGDEAAAVTAASVIRTDDSTPSTALGAAWMLRSPIVSKEVAATLRRELTLVRDERLSIEAAIDREPDNTVLRELWAHTYQIELELADAWGRTIMAYEIG